MIRRINIDLRGFLLLAIYLFSNSPLLLFHHHEHHRIAFNKASTCEKAIFYGKIKDACHHKAHISKGLDKCSLCDQNTVSVHSIPTIGLNILEVLFLKKESFTSRSFTFAYFERPSNRGPPLV